MKANYFKHILHFRQPAGTSRGIHTEKETWFIVIEKDGKKGVGECGLLRGLSVDDRSDYEDKLKWVCDNICLGEEIVLQNTREFPSIQFGLQTAFLSLQNENPFLLFPSSFTFGQKTIPINGLVWMGDISFMKNQIEQKLSEGFSCIKLKIGALDFDEELKLLDFIRRHFSSEQIEIRVDANGAFRIEDALDKLKKLAKYDIHSIEQPIGKGQTEAMANLCRNTPVPIVLDEELIGIFDFDEKEHLLQKIRPQYIILKPSFVGGFRGAEEWIVLAKKHNIGWWVTSALESNIGLNAIAQWTFVQNNILPQGLGTGALYSNNYDCPLRVEKGNLKYDNSLEWKFNFDDFRKYT